MTVWLIKVCIGLILALIALNIMVYHYAEQLKQRFHKLANFLYLRLLKP